MPSPPFALLLLLLLLLLSPSLSLPSPSSAPPPARRSLRSAPPPSPPSSSPPSSPPPSPSPLLSSLRNGLASGLAAGSVKLLLAPFDTIKTLQQHHRSLGPGSLGSAPLSLAGAARKLLERGGAGELYAGIGVTVVGSMPSVGLYFGVYLTTLNVMCAAATGNAVASFSRVPYEVVKQKLQTGFYPSTGAALAGMWRSGGVGAFFPSNGVAVQMFRDIPYAVFTLLTYEYLQERYCAGAEDGPDRQYVCERCVLIKAVYRPLSAGRTAQACAAGLKASKEPASKSWKVAFETFAWKYTRAEQAAMRQEFIAKLAPQGPACMQAPDLLYTVVHEFAVTPDGSPVRPRTDHTGLEVAANAGLEPLAVYLGLGFCLGARGLCDKYDLKKRSFLGPTSMDNELSMIMCTSALVRPGSLVFDPFVGTGSILFSAAVFGAVTFGTDIDIRILRGKGAGNPFTNFEKAGLPLPDI
ncbi:hypothetical protein TeGR_g9767, partial [Tetraparma gracilis]